MPASLAGSHVSTLESFRTHQGRFDIDVAADTEVIIDVTTNGVA